MGSVAFSTGPVKAAGEYSADGSRILSTVQGLSTCTSCVTFSVYSNSGGGVGHFIPIADSTPSSTRRAEAIALSSDVITESFFLIFSDRSSPGPVRYVSEPSSFEFEMKSPRVFTDDAPRVVACTPSYRARACLGVTSLPSSSKYLGTALTSIHLFLTILGVRRAPLSWPGSAGLFIATLGF